MRDSSKETRGDELLARVLSGKEWKSGISNDLLNEFFRGYPKEHLVRLLRSDDERIVQSGAWIASELAKDAKPILRYLIPLFDYPNVSVRSYCVETVLTAATDQDGEVVGRAVPLITDPEQPVRRMTFKFMARADSLTLAAGIPHINNPKIAASLEWALEVERGSRDSHEIESRLREPDELVRLFAVIAAARVCARNLQYLQLAASSHGDTKTFAISELEWLISWQERTRRRRERAEGREARERSETPDAQAESD